MPLALQNPAIGAGASYHVAQKTRALSTDKSVVSVLPTITILIEREKIPFSN
jgi:hypothetical protein